MKEAFKKDPILFISGILALMSCFLVFPDAEYIGYINFRVLAILFSLMLVVAELLRIGTFDYLTGKLLSRIRGSRYVSLLLIVLSFFMAMFLTNDVTLVTLVPFAIAVLKIFNDKKGLMFTLILMTVGANLGSMLTPIGNPQNLYLYTQYRMSFLPFIKLMLPYASLSLLLLIASVFLLTGNRTADKGEGEQTKRPDTVKLILCLLLFVLCVLSVADIVPWTVMLPVVVLIMLLTDRKAFKYVDFMLLLTFVFFFVLIGNLGRIPVIHDTLSEVVSVSPMLTAVFASQIISNVPAAMLLSAFTDNGKALVIGTNLGGLGTLIASMASLITYKFHNALPKERKGPYLLSFTIINVVFLGALLLLYYIIP
ncbi:MAG TPA: citrate transporter [Clostridiales bacterium]|nr:citrate transporter [Clostridiales bacterium]